MEKKGNGLVQVCLQNGNTVPFRLFRVNTTLCEEICVVQYINDGVMSYECNLNVNASSRGDHCQRFEESTYFFPYLIRPESATSCRPRAKVALSA